MTDETNKELAVVVLAAGQGARMKSSRAKMLHELCGRSMLGHVLASAGELAPKRLIVVVGRDAENFEEEFAGQLEFVHQSEQKGTGDAVKQALPALEGFSGDVLILYGDGYNDPKANAMSKRRKTTTLLGSRLGSRFCWAVSRLLGDRLRTYLF